MHLTVTEAKARLTDLVRRAEAGEEIVLTRHGKPVVRFVALGKRPNATERRDIITAVRVRAAAKASSGPSAARSQDFLYDENGLPL